MLWAKVKSGRPKARMSGEFDRLTMIIRVTKTEVSNDQSKRLQHCAEGARLHAHLAGQGHVPVRRTSGKRGHRRSTARRLTSSALPSKANSIWPAPSDGNGEKPAQARWRGLAGARLQHH